MVAEPHNVAVIPGDLNGKTVTNAVLELYGSFSSVLDRPIKHTGMPYDADYFVKNDMTELGPKERDKLQQFDQIFLGAIGDPTKIKKGILEKGILLNLRQKFDQYVNLRPIDLPEGVPSPLVDKGPEDISFEICRENSEGLYVGEGGVENKGTENEVGIQEMHCTYKGVRRLADFAIDRAKKRAKEGGYEPRLHFVFKSNVLTEAAVPWDRVMEEMREENPDINIEYMHVDAFAMNMISNPEKFDTVITENMFGDILTDLGAILQGGIGSAVSGNINPTGEYPSMFEPIHGSAPDKWYEQDNNGKYIPGTYCPDKVQQIRPEAAFMSYSMMLEQMGEERASNLVKGAALANLRDPQYKGKRLDDLVSQAKEFIDKRK